MAELDIEYPFYHLSSRIRERSWEDRKRLLGDFTEVLTDAIARHDLKFVRSACDRLEQLLALAEALPDKTPAEKVFEERFRGILAVAFSGKVSLLKLS